MFKKKKVVLDPQEEIWYSHVISPLSELESLCAKKTLQKKKIVKAAIKIYSMSEFTPLLNHPDKTYDARPEVCGGVVSLTQKAEKILAGEDLDIDAECKQVNDHKLDSKEIVQYFNHTLLA
tara:strand:- start:68 stop:430 length:363 start_codon:yes stop_codon:yes gene_type:complete